MWVGALNKGSLNESPSEKEGKFLCNIFDNEFAFGPSMKVPPKRKGNKPTRCGWV